MQAIHAKAEVEKEVMLQFRNKRSPQVQQLSLGNEALERQINNYSNMLQNRSNQVGSLKVGKDADIVIWDGHPMSLYTKAEQTYIEGALYFDKNEHKKKLVKIKDEKSAL